MTPTSDTNELGHSRAPVDPLSVAFQSEDDVGHLGWALQASGTAKLMHGGARLSLEQAHQGLRPVQHS